MLLGKYRKKLKGGKQEATECCLGCSLILEWRRDKTVSVFYENLKGDGMPCIKNVWLVPSQKKGFCTCPLIPLPPSHPLRI